MGLSFTSGGTFDPLRVVFASVVFFSFSLFITFSFSVLAFGLFRFLVFLLSVGRLA